MAVVAAPPDQTPTLDCYSLRFGVLSHGRILLCTSNDVVILMWIFRL